MSTRTTLNKRQPNLYIVSCPKRGSRNLADDAPVPNADDTLLPNADDTLVSNADDEERAQRGEKKPPGYNGPRQDVRRLYSYALIEAFKIVYDFLKPAAVARPGE